MRPYYFYNGYPYIHNVAPGRHAISNLYDTFRTFVCILDKKKTCNSLSISPALLTRARGQFPNDGDGEDSFHNKPISYLSAQQRGEILHDIGEGREETVLKIISKISD